MGNTQQRGGWGEETARAYLERKGWGFITANWRCALGEIDLVMQDGATRVLVEVRLRQAGAYGAGEDTVGLRKQSRLRRSAALYQQQENYWDDIRIDVISIQVFDNSPPGIEHIEAAVEE